MKIIERINTRGAHSRPAIIFFSLSLSPYFHSLHHIHRIVRYALLFIYEYISFLLPSISGNSFHSRCVSCHAGNCDIVPGLSYSYTHITCVCVDVHGTVCHYWPRLIFHGKLESETQKRTLGQHNELLIWIKSRRVRVERKFMHRQCVARTAGSAFCWPTKNFAACVLRWHSSSSSLCGRRHSIDSCYAARRSTTLEAKMPCRYIYISLITRVFGALHFWCSRRGASQ